MRPETLERVIAAFHLHFVDSLSFSRKLDGLIMVDVPITDGLAQRLEQDNFPYILVEYPRPGASCVAIDNIEGGRLVAQYLDERGYRRCAFLGLSAEPEPPLGYPTLDDLRLQGFREGLATAALDLPDLYVQPAPIPVSRREMEGGVFLGAVHKAANTLMDISPHHPRSSQISTW